MACRLFEVIKSILGIDLHRRCAGALSRTVRFSSSDQTIRIRSDRCTADVYAGSQIGWGMMFGGIEKRPAFERYWDRIGTRPAAVRAREIDDALMPPRPAATP